MLVVNNLLKNFSSNNCTFINKSFQDIFRREDGSWRRQQAVSLDGTMFQKSGVISGGAYDLQRKAQKWEEKELDQLRAKRDQLHETVLI